MARVGEGLGLIETIRARGGGLPWLGRHLARLHASVAALGLAAPPDDVAEMLRACAGEGDRIVRLELHEGRPEITTRDLNRVAPPSVVVSGEVHRPYPYKTTGRHQFGRALAGARRVSADDALLFTAQGFVAEGTSWSVFWWDRDVLCTPAADLGVLPGIGRGRIMELTAVREVRARASVLAQRSLFLVNSVRGIVEISALERIPVPRDPRTHELSAAFWPD